MREVVGKGYAGEPDHLLEASNLEGTHGMPGKLLRSQREELAPHGEGLQLTGRSWGFFWGKHGTWAGLSENLSRGGCSGTGKEKDWRGRRGAWGKGGGSHSHPPEVSNLELGLQEWERTSRLQPCLPIVQELMPPQHSQNKG